MIWMEKQIQQINEAQSNRIYVSIEDIPEDMQHAIVAIEDSRFYEHHGIDFRGMLRSSNDNGNIWISTDGREPVRLPSS